MITTEKIDAAQKSTNFVTGTLPTSVTCTLTNRSQVPSVIRLKTATSSSTVEWSARSSSPS